jgi:hypothetical protein
MAAVCVTFNPQERRGKVLTATFARCVKDFYGRVVNFVILEFNEKADMMKNEK